MAALSSKRAGSVMKSVLKAANDASPTPLTALEGLSEDEIEGAVRVVNVLEKMGYITLQADASGNVSFRLTDSGKEAQLAFLGGR